MIGAIGAKEFYVERGQLRRADHDNVLDSGLVLWFSFLFVLIKQQHHHAGDEKAGSKDQNSENGSRAWNAVETGEREQDDARHQTSGEHGLDDVKGVINREM